MGYEVIKWHGKKEDDAAYVEYWKDGVRTISLAVLKPALPIITWGHG